MKKIRIILGAMIVAMVMGGCGDKQKNKLLQKGVNAFYGSEGTELDREEAFRLFSEAAEAGNARAMYNIGCLYQKGQGVDQDYQKAFEYYEKAAEMGDEMAVSRIRDLVNNGCISRDEAEKWMD